MKMKVKVKTSFNMNTMHRASTRNASNNRRLASNNACRMSMVKQASRLDGMRLGQTKIRHQKKAAGVRGRGRRQWLSVNASAFGQLTRRLDDTWKKVKGVDKLTSENLKEPLKDIRRALLEADVSLGVVRKFVKTVEERALGSSVLHGLDPDQQLVKVVRDELVSLMGTENQKLTEAEEDKPQVIFLLGLQGVGKTTTCAKLAKLIKEDKSVCMIAADTYRPAAIEQLKKLGQKIDVPVFAKDLDSTQDPVQVVKDGIAFAKENEYKSVIVDTAGRLQIDVELMSQLKDMKAEVSPSDTLLVVDAMTGQEAASLVKTFDDEVGLTGSILSKIDGDSRGGAALSMKSITGKPIKYVSNGEGMTDLEPFYPDRMASRILGMGDVLTLVEKAEESFKEEEVERLQNKIMSAKFDFNDFIEQLNMMNRMGSLGQTMRLIPGMNRISDKQMMEAERSMARIKDIIDVMTDEEKENPDLVATSMEIKERIAKESDNNIKTVDAMITQFMTVRQQMQKMSQVLSAKEELANLVGEEGLKDIKGLPSDLQSQGQVGRKIAKGKVLRKKTAAPTPARGFGKK